MKRPATFLYINLVIFIIAFVASCGSGSGSDNTVSVAGQDKASVLNVSAQKAATAPVFKISGRVHYGAEGLYGAQVELIGAKSAIAMTNAGGDFSFDALPNGRYTITPSKAGFTFDLINAVVTVDNADISSLDITASSDAGPLHRLSGRITSDNAPLKGVSIGLSGAASAVYYNDGTITDGGYLTGPLPDGLYSITPSKPGYVFFPASVAVFVKGNDVSNVDFAGAVVATRTYKLSGRVAFGSTGLNGAIIKLRGPVTAATVTDRGGNFSILSLPDADYSLSASMRGYVFTPNERSISIKGSDVSGADFNAAGAGYTVSGRAHYPQCPECIVQGVTVSLNTDPPISTITGINGSYNFKNVPSGNYRITPDKSGVQSVFLPASKAINVEYENVADADFAVNTAYSVSGAVSYAGAKKGRVYAGLYYADTNDANYSGTSIQGPGPFAVRGVSPGNYRLCAWMDTLDTGRRNAASPSGCSEIFSVIGGPLTGINVNLVDAPEPKANPPAKVNASPFEGGAVVTWSPYRINNIEAAQSYNIYYSTSPQGIDNGQGAKIPDIAAIDDGHYIVNGLTNGQTYYFSVTSVVNGRESAMSPLSAPIIAGAKTGPGTITGLVEFGDKAGGPLYVGYYGSEGRIYMERILNPVSPAEYSISGVLKGVYVPFVFIDSDGSNTVTPGDARNDFQNGNFSFVTMPGGAADNIVKDISVIDANASVGVTTNHWTDGLKSYYSVRITAGGSARRIVAASVESGVNIAAPSDLANLGGYFSKKAYLDVVTPLVGDVYEVKLTYADGSTETVYKAINGVVDGFAEPISPVGSARGVYVPTFKWRAPMNAPASFIYNVEVVSIYTGFLWRTNDSAIGLPGNADSVLYNYDNFALKPALSHGEAHFWELSVTDSTGNSSSRQTDFTP